MADETKAVPVPASALIPLKGTHFCNMGSVDDLRSAISAAPPPDQSVPRSFLASGVEQSVHIARVNIQPRKIEKLQCGRGAYVRDTRLGKKGTIVKMNAGYTKKTHTPVHKIRNQRGDEWLAKETNIEVLI